MKKCKIQGQVTTIQMPFTYNRKSTNFSSAQCKYLRKGHHVSVNAFCPQQSRASKKQRRFGVILALQLTLLKEINSHTKTLAQHLVSFPH